MRLRRLQTFQIVARLRAERSPRSLREFRLAVHRVNLIDRDSAVHQARDELIALKRNALRQQVRRPLLPPQVSRALNEAPPYRAATSEYAPASAILRRDQDCVRV